jgi:hypothetical protein
MKKEDNFLRVQMDQLDILKCGGIPMLDKNNPLAASSQPPLSVHLRLRDGGMFNKIFVS